MVLSRVATSILRWPVLPAQIARHAVAASDVTAQQRRFCSAQLPNLDFQTVTVDVKDGIAVVLLAQPKTLNALSTKVMHEVVHAMHTLDAYSPVKAIVLTGQGKAFAAGADIKEMIGKSDEEARQQHMYSNWDKLRAVKKPIIAAVNGYALGGGCELAMMCDIIIASDEAVFGQPEVGLGVIPGMGGTQRLTALVGRARAMDMVLTGSRLTAAQAEAAGLVSRVVAPSRLLDEAERIARKIASYSAPVVAKAKACVHAAEETHLAEGLRMERHEFWSCFGLQDQKEGMMAFLEKRKPNFKDM